MSALKLKPLKTSRTVRALLTLPARPTLLLLLALLFSLGQPPVPAQSSGPAILPAREDAIGGGNPFEGLGRADDPNPSRVEKYQTQTPAADAETAPAASPESSTKTPEADAAAREKPSQAGDKPPQTGDKPTQTGDKPTPPGEKKKEQRKWKLLSEPKTLSAVPDPMVKEALREMQNGRYQDALRHLEGLKRLNPNAPELDYLMAVACVMSLRFEEAREHYEKVLQSQAPPELHDLARKGLNKLK